MNYTENYNLKKPAQTDYYDVDDFNANADTTDAKLKDLYDRKAEIATGTYTGAGKDGPSNQNSLTFAFHPKLVLIQKSGGAVANATAIINGSDVSMYVQTSDARTGQTATYTASTKTLKWYSGTGIGAGNPDRQMNESGTTYTYVAIGKL